MVTRLPTPSQDVPAPLSMTVSKPPYPTDSRMPSREGQYEQQSNFEQISAMGPSAPNGMGTLSRQSSLSSHGTWNSDASEREEEDEPAAQLPEALIPGPRKSQETNNAASTIPAALRPGIPRKPVDGQISHSAIQTAPANPYAAAHAPRQASFSGPPESAAANPPVVSLNRLSLDPHAPEPPQRQAHAPSYSPPPAPSGLRPHATGRSNTSQSSNPWQKDLDREQERLHAQKTGNSSDDPQPLIDIHQPQPPPLNRTQTSSAFAPEVVPESVLHDQAQTSPRTTQQGPVPPIKTGNASPLADGPPRIDSPLTQARKQRGEVYHIKHINWYDASSGPTGSLRRSPILTQNANGPCPLLALVNALSLTTPEHEQTALLHHLKTREQITLGLLLDAVFEELVRRNEQTGVELPNIGDLYSFLLTLHTGMNVNPAFTSSGPDQPGGFENTKEMQQYGAFSIPLVHGWTVPYKSGTYMSFERSAKTFDEALNVQFLEEEFENKLRSGGLNKEEQQVFQDLTSVKQFLTNFPTQLSDYGLDTIASWLQPGKFAILFRNDHFCTLYKEPKKGILMTLVTDAGYATHDEVVWESLVDINGAAAQLFSGDFRPIGNAPSASRQNSTSVEEWQQVRWSRKMSGPTSPTVAARSSAETAPATPSKAEQEDQDLALALQLQEEEEQASRRAEARRSHARAESLSRQYLQRRSFDSGNGRAPSLPRRSSRSQRGSTQVMNSSSRTNDDTAPPPSYEEAASDMPYREAGSTPRPPRQGNALDALSALNAQRHQSAFAAQSGSQPQQMAPGYGRRTSHRFSGGMPAAQGQYANVGGGRYGEEKCRIM